MAVRGDETVKVRGLAEFQREIRKLNEAGLIDQLRDANAEVAQLVIDRARQRARALGGMEAKAAESLTARRGQRSAEVALGGRGYDFAAGAEFGAYRDKVRLMKASGTRKRTRAYMVRAESERAIRQATKRIEAQRNINTGQQVKVTGRTIGWNQFRRWRGNSTGAGYFLFPSIRDRADEIAEVYGDALDRISKQAFPD